MTEKDPRIDNYISKSEVFAQPILKHLRQLVHKACPDVEETMKWSFPHFDYKGSMCSMASFKNHCAFGFWKGSIMKDSDGVLHEQGNSGMGSLGKIASLKDLPNDRTLIAYIKQAVQLNEDGIKLPPRKKTEEKDLLVPPGLAAALRKNKQAQTVFEGFSPSHKKEYIEWITEAKTEATREKRIESAIEMLTEGKTRNWKYVRK
ncbi:MAG: YdeI family protein [Chitinophagaceae bacterium]